MTSKQEQFYKQQIADLQVENVALKEQVAELLKANEQLVRKNAELTERVTKLTEKVAKLSRNSSNSSKSPSSDIVKPPKAKQADVPRRQGGQSGHKVFNRQPFGLGQIELIKRSRFTHIVVIVATKALVSRLRSRKFSRPFARRLLTNGLHKVAAR